jgi:Rad3-related DNA helicase
MTYNLKELTFQNQIPVIENILKKYEKNNGIIHTTNYELANWIKNSIKSDRLIFHETEDREKIYKGFINNNDNKVIVSPSMTTGISLDDELSRFQILLKVPYPNISSNKIKARQRSNKKWYDYTTCIEIMQAYGRVVRSDTDWGHTFILDSCFSDVLKKTNYFPRWFTDAIKILK